MSHPVTVTVTETAIILMDPSAHTGGPYEIDFDRCKTPEQILDWVSHLCDKLWVTRQQIKLFIGHAAEHHGIKFRP
jgi:hypothetical protein